MSISLFMEIHELEKLQLISDKTIKYIIFWSNENKTNGACSYEKLGIITL
jgi:hypothetical protein